MQCNAMQGERNARPKGRLLIREWNPALTATAFRDGHGSISHLPGQLRTQCPACPAAARRHIRHRASECRTLPALPALFCPSCLAKPPADSLGKCMQVLGTQSNLPTLLLSIRLAGSLSPGPHTSKYIHYTAGEMTTPSHASRLTTTGDQQQSTAVPFCPVWNACTVPEIST